MWELGSPDDEPRKPTRWGGGTSNAPKTITTFTSGPPSLLGPTTTKKRASNPESAKQGYEAALSFYSNEPPKPKKEEKPSIDLDFSKFEPYDSPSPSETRRSRSLTAYGSTTAGGSVDPVRKSNSITAGAPAPAANERPPTAGGGYWDELKTFGTKMENMTTTLLKHGSIGLPTAPTNSTTTTTTAVPPQPERKKSLPPQNEQKKEPQRIQAVMEKVPEKKEPTINDEAPKEKKNPGSALPESNPAQPSLVSPVTEGITDTEPSMEKSAPIQREEEEDDEDVPPENKILLDDDELLRVAQFKMKTNQELKGETVELKQKYQEALSSIEALTHKLNKESERVQQLEDEVKQLTKHNTKLTEFIQQHTRAGPAATIATASPVKGATATAGGATPTKGKTTGKLW